MIPTSLALTLALPGVVAHLLRLIVTHLNLACAPSPSNHAMLNQKVEQLQATVTQQQATVAQQQKQIETLTTQLREQAAQIQKVSAQLEIDPADAASGGESIRLLLRSAVREVSVSSIQIQPPRESRAAAVLLYCSRFAVRSADPSAHGAFPAAPLTERRLQLNSFGWLESA